MTQDTNLDPDWEPVIWGEDYKEQAIIWYGGELPETYFRYGTPRIEDETEDLNCYYNPIKNQLKTSDQLYDVSDAHEKDLYRSRSFSIDDSVEV